MITIPVSFDSYTVFNEVTKKFEDQVEAICKKLGVTDVWDKIEFLKLENTRQFGIIDFHMAVDERSDQYKAQNEILAAWDEIFSEQGFLDL